MELHLPSSIMSKIQYLFADSDEMTFRNVRISVEDYGQGRPLPSYAAVEPNKNYYNSNLSVYNM